MSISAVARRHGLSASQLFTWRRQARCAPVSCSLEDGLRFMPALLTPEPRQPTSDKAEISTRRGPASCTGIELELAGARMHSGFDAGVEAIAAVIRALKATA
ncbi:transposase [Methylobacterium sp. Leaf113]|uniref:transposase n=1 Tax=Methylobacterium sp. Leaf113 TaxID=1736259 RepID=UPI0009E96C9C